MSFLLLFCFPLTAKESTTTPPKKHQVVLVMKVNMQPGINDQFFSKYYDADSKTMIIPKKEKGSTVVKSTFELVTIKNFLNLPDIKFEETDGVLMAKEIIPLDRKMELLGIRMNLAGISALSIVVPIRFDLEIPPETNYIYLGTFRCVAKSPTYIIESVSIEDEYDEAKAEVEKLYGKDAKLVRVKLKNPE